MDVTNIAALATDLASQRTGDAVGVSVLKKALDTEVAAAAALLAAIPPAPRPSEPTTLGGIIDTTA